MESEFASDLFLSKKVIKRLSKIDAVIDYTIEGERSLGEGTSVNGSLILNDYDPPSNSKHFSVQFNETVLWALLDGDNAASLGSHFKLSGDLGLAATIGRAFTA